MLKIPWLPEQQCNQVRMTNWTPQSRVFGSRKAEISGLCDVVAN
jgi:hypothetical protein